MTEGAASEVRQPTQRQLEVLRLMAQGLRQHEIAARMVVTVQSVKNHKTNAYERLGVKSGIQAFIALGWLRVPDA